MNVICFYCGRTFRLKPFCVKRSKNHYCNRECMSKGFRLKYENSKTEKGRCPQCGHPVFRKPASNGSKQKFCNDECYRKWRAISKATMIPCAVCGKSFHSMKSTSQVCCSTKCGYIYMSEKRRTIVVCRSCGKSFTRWASYAAKHPGSLCSAECYFEYNKLSSSFSWKGGSYSSSQGCVMVLLGHYNYASASRAKKNLKYKRRHRVIVELFLGYDLQNSASVMKLRGSEQLKNLYVCQSHSEHLKILNGSLPIPNKSNLSEIKKHQFCKAKPSNYERLPDEWISKFVINSFRLSESSPNVQN